MLAEKKLLEAREPVLSYMKTAGHPVGIKEVAERIGAKYDMVKQRLRKLERLRVIKRFRPGVYALSEFVAPELKSPVEKGAITNGAIGIVDTSGESYRLLVYNCRVAQALKNSYVQVWRRKDLFIVQKAPSYMGHKVSVYKRGNASVWISKAILNDEEKALLKSGKTITVGVMIYPAEFSLSLSEVFGTEAREDGILAEALFKRGLGVKKFGRQGWTKGDLEVTLPVGNVMVEITRALPCDKVRRSHIKSYEILGRLYYALKWVHSRHSPAFIVIHEAWKKGNWIRCEKEYLQKIGVHLLFTNFENDWGDKVADEILCMGFQ